MNPFTNPLLLGPYLIGALVGSWLLSRAWRFIKSHITQPKLKKLGLVVGLILLVGVVIYGLWSWSDNINLPRWGWWPPTTANVVAILVALAATGFIIAKHHKNKWVLGGWGMVIGALLLIFFIAGGGSSFQTAQPSPHTTAECPGGERIITLTEEWQALNPNRCRVVFRVEAGGLAEMKGVSGRTIIVDANGGNFVNDVFSEARSRRAGTVLHYALCSVHHPHIPRIGWGCLPF